MKLKGIIPPMVTPLKDDNVLDLQGTERLIEHVISGNVHGIFILGTTGEAQSIPACLKYEFIEFVCQQVAGRVPILVGITDTSMSDSIRMAFKAKECGAKAVVAAPPYYFPPSQQELIEYYTTLADAVPLPLYLYNMPSHVKVGIAPSTVQALAHHPNIWGLKDSSANMVYFQTVIYQTRDIDCFSVYIGPEELTGECILSGAAGAVNGGANLFPKLYVKLYEAAQKLEIDGVRELQKQVMQISTSIYNVGKYSSSYLKGVKCALSLMGICNDHLAYPYRKFREAERRQIQKALENLGVQL